MKDTGGSAFPVAHQILDANHEHFKSGCKGMTLRDYFAAKAISGLIDAEYNHGIFKHMCPSAMTTIASHAYELADAMLNERQKNVEN
jgi:hypothetical protein